MLMLGMKLGFLFISHLYLVTNRSFLRFHCSSIDFLFRILLIICDWLNASVTIERSVAIIKGVSFDKSKSKRASRWVLLFIVLLSVSTSVQDPIFRRLIYDEEDKRIWCVTKYPSHIQDYNSVVALFHYSVPLMINLLGALLMIVMVARIRLNAKKQQSYAQYLLQQLKIHKHLLISGFALVILELPRPVFSFLYDCIKRVRDPWLPLIGYFLSCLPPVCTFIIFILPSPSYRENFKKGMQCILRHVRRN